MKLNEYSITKITKPVFWFQKIIQKHKIVLWMYLVRNCYITLQNQMGKKVITAQIKIIASVISSAYYLIISII